MVLEKLLPTPLANLGSLPCKWSGFYFFLSLIFVFFLVVAPSLAEHDMQRVGQVAVGVVSLVFLLSKSLHCDGSLFFGRTSGYLLFLVAISGVISSAFSHRFSWAISDVCLFVVCCGIANFFAVVRVQIGAVADRCLGYFLLILCLVKTTQFFSSALGAFLNEAGKLDLDLLVVGFSNKRFYGQFQTFTLPLLAVPLLLHTFKPSTKAWIFGLLACWWMIAICGGTRGTWLGMGCAAAVLFFCGPFGRRWCCWQLAATAVGLLLFWCLFSLLPGYLGIEILNFAGDRLTTSLSARDVIWHQAWEMIKERPLLGFGPMHFADIHNPVAAHPHQAILQWACEWGVPSTLLVGWLAARGLFSTLMLIRKKAASSEPVDLLRICLFASLLGALAQSMVDGVIVMPYSQLWLAIVVGWLLGIHEWAVKPEPTGPILRWGWLGTLAIAVGFLVYVVARDFPHLDEREQQYGHDFGGNFQPRFWLQGVIAVKPE
jgi:O-antigen ligase